MGLMSTAELISNLQWELQGAMHLAAKTDVPALRTKHLVAAANFQKQIRDLQIADRER